MKDKKLQVVQNMKNKQVAINSGTNDGILKKGDTVIIIDTKYNLTDPVTKENLGIYYTHKDILNIVEVYDKFSIAKKTDTSLSALASIAPITKYTDINTSVQRGDEVIRGDEKYVAQKRKMW